MDKAFIYINLNFLSAKISIRNITRGGFVDGRMANRCLPTVPGINTNPPATAGM